MIKNFLEIMKAPTFSLNSRDLKIQLIGNIVLFTLFSFLLSILLESLLSDVSFLVLFSFLESGIIVTIPFFFWDRFANNNEMHDSNDYLGLSFKGLIIVLFFLCLGFFVGFTLLGYFINSIFFGLGWGLAIFFPICIIFFRRKIFRENSQYLNNEEKGIGFNPKIYVALGIAISLLLIPSRFSSLHQSFYNNNPHIFVSLGMLLFSFVYIALVLSPDIMNKVLPFEIRKRSGFIVYSIVSISLSLIITILINCLNH